MRGGLRSSPTQTTPGSSGSFPESMGWVVAVEFVIILALEGKALWDVVEPGYLVVLEAEGV